MYITKEAIGSQSSISYSEAARALKSLGFIKDKGSKHEDWWPSIESGYPTHYPEDYPDSRFAGRKIVYRQHRSPSPEALRGPEYKNLKNVLEAVGEGEVYRRLEGLNMTKKVKKEKPEEKELPIIFLPRWSERAFEIKKLIMNDIKFGKSELKEGEVDDKIYSDMIQSAMITDVPKEEFLKVMDKEGNIFYHPSKFDEGDILAAVSIVNSMGEPAEAKMSLDLLGEESVDDKDKKDFNFHIKNLIKKRKVSVTIRNGKEGIWTTDLEEVTSSDKNARRLLKTASAFVAQNQIDEARMIYKLLFKNKSI